MSWVWLFLSNSTASALVQTFIISSQELCNSLLYREVSLQLIFSSLQSILQTAIKLLSQKITSENANVCFLVTNVELCRIVQMRLIIGYALCFMNSILSISVEDLPHFFFHFCLLCPVQWWMQLNRCSVQTWIINCFIIGRISAFWGNVRFIFLLAAFF